MKGEKWGIIASICVVVLLVGAIVILAFTGGTLKTRIAARYSDQAPVPDTKADIHYKEGHADPGYDREAALDAKIAQYKEIYGEMGASAEELNNEYGKETKAINDKPQQTIALVDGNPVKLSELERARLLQRASFIGGAMQYSAATFTDDSQRLQFKEDWTKTASDADIVYNAIANRVLLNEAEKLGLTVSLEDAKTAVVQQLNDKIASIPQDQQAAALAPLTAYIQGLGMTIDQYLDYEAAQSKDSFTIQNLMSNFGKTLPQEVLSNQESATKAWNTYLDGLIGKASITLK